ncbi:oxalate/formate MFS antiporter, partial [Azospirillum brasilense]|nr:oxalate/formate MFS antiporter [Azospirillum brasilense]
MQIVVGIVCMVAAANIQYAWTLFVPEIQATHGWTRASIQTAFTVFVVVQTWLTPIEGYFIDRYGPRAIVAFGGVMTGLSWIVDSYAGSLGMLYVGSAIGGIGVGCVYATCVNSAIKWFPDKRGLAVGLTAGGYGAGSALTILPIANMIHSSGYQATFFWFGLLQGAIIIAAAYFLRAPQKDQGKASTKVLQSRRDYTLKEALQTPVFWVMMVMFICTVSGGLMAVAQLGVIAHDLGVKEAPISLFGITMAALPFALMLDRVMNGISRPLFGFISDHIGREATMFIAFTFEG